MTVLAFTITFHSPFRVGAAYAQDGVHAAIDRDDPLPADHVKGVMRAAAADLFGDHRHWAIAEVFGSPAAPSPWSWSAATPAGVPGQWEFGRRHRVRIDPEKHSAMKDRLVLGEQAWAEAARFTVARAGTLQSGHRLGEEDHVRILRCAAAAVHGLGSWRRRGLGWVGITPEDAEITSQDVLALRALAKRDEADR
ncbi:MAG: RAMP superfamily CRISPR-associated protein [Streptosporangiaceae bacterium]